MKRLLAGSMSIAVLVSIPQLAGAQAKTVASEMREETGVVQAIDPATREVTLKKADGTVFMSFDRSVLIPKQGHGVGDE